MQDEMESLQKNHTYEIVNLPQGKNALKNKWVFKMKKDGSRKVVKHKTRLIVKGFQQKKRQLTLMRFFASSKNDFNKSYSYLGSQVESRA